jgi:Fe-S-cluster containining protein
VEKIVKGLKIDPRIFTFPFGCRCTGECCHYGVYTDLKEHQAIMEIKDKIIPLLDDSQPRDTELWFEDPEKDEDFESGVAVGTELYNGKCVFLDKAGLCTLQKLAIMEDAEMWKYKPLYCILFPLTIYQEAITIDDEHIERLKTCNNNRVNGTSIYEACRDELRHLFGEDGMAEIEEYRLQLNESKTNEINTGVLDATKD